MKFNKTLKLISITLVALFALSACESHKAEKNIDKNNLLWLALLNGNTANAEIRGFCATAVLKMNQCIGSASGFNPAIMCNDSNLNQGVTADPKTTPPTVAQTSSEVYTALISCVDTQVALTNCNFPQNRVASPNQAKQSFFSKCDSPSGLIVTIF